MILLAVALAQAVATPAAATLQSQFELANAAFEAKKWKDALERFAAIEGRPGASERTIGIARLRKGIALANTGHDDDAQQTLRSGLALTTREDEAVTEFRVSAALELGKIEKSHFDYSAARRSLELILRETSDPAYSLAALLEIVPVVMFADSDAALNYAHQAVKIAADHHAAAPIDARAHDLLGRVLLNRGDVPAAIEEFKIAVKELGGVTTSSDTNDVVVRSDLAIAHLLAKHEHEARDLMAMAGAGRSPKTLVAPVAQPDLPACGGTLQPNDTAIVEFAVGDDGRVLYAQPIYASRPGDGAVDFAKAVGNWSWRADQIASVPAFYRTGLRVELRCSTAPQRPPALSALRPDLDRWLAARGVPPLSETVQLRRLLEQLDRSAATGTDSVALMPALIAVGESRAVENTLRADAWNRAVAVANAERAPIAATSYLRGFEILTTKPWSPGRAGQLTRAANSPDVASNARARAALLLAGVDLLSSARQGDAAGVLQTIIADTRLDPKDPLRIGALVRLSSIQARKGDLDAARSAYLSTGLSSQQCALFDASPLMKSFGLDGADYPLAAQQRAVSGWTQVEFDIQANGQTANQRAIISYPPFVFSEAVVIGLQRSRFDQSYRPDGGLGCGGAHYFVNFLSN